jgi:hypothetical protein
LVYYGKTTITTIISFTEQAPGKNNLISNLSLVLLYPRFF